MNQKGLVTILIIALVAIFALGGGYFVYQKSQISKRIPPYSNQVACTQDAKQCPDGSYVSRSGPKCEFSPCPTPESTNSAETAIMCGGIAGKICPEGYECKLDGNYADAAGKCIKK